MPLDAIATELNSGPEPREPREPREALEVRISRTGNQLLSSLARVLAHVPGSEAGPLRLAAALGVDKVLASRLLKAVRSPDAVTIMHRAPGPEPLRRVLRASERYAVPVADMHAACAAVDAFENLIRTGTGDRSGLEAVLSAWAPDARRDFELRRKQAAFRAVSQLKGMQTDVFAEAAIFWPSADGKNIDVVWMKSVTGLTALRPGVTIKLTSKRGIEAPAGRHPMTLTGEPVESVKNTVIPQFCSEPTPELIARVVGESTHYLLERARLGEPMELLLCEVNRAELPRYVPLKLGRRAWASNDISLPAQRCQFDLLIHPDLYPGEHPDLRVYDTAILGLADRNDSARDIDQFDLLETVDNLGVGVTRFGSSDVPRYREVLDYICQQLNYDGSILRGYRVASSYPIYGSQYAMSIRTTEPPG